MARSAFDMSGRGNLEDILLEALNGNNLNACILETLLARVLGDKGLGLQNTDMDCLDTTRQPLDSFHTGEVPAQPLGAWLDCGVQGQVCRQDISQILFRDTMFLGQLQETALFGMGVTRKLQGVTSCEDLVGGCIHDDSTNPVVCGFWW